MGVLILLPLLGVALQGTSSVLYATIGDLVDQDRLPRAFGFFYTLGSLCGIAAPLGYGLLGDISGVTRRSASWVARSAHGAARGDAAAGSRCAEARERLSRYLSKGFVMSRQRISYFPLEKMDDAMRAEMDRCAREGTPRPESSAVRAHVPGRLLVVREFVARHLPQRRVRSRDQGALPALCLALGEMRVLRQPALDQGVRRETERVADRRSRELREVDEIHRKEKAALAYAEAITWRLETDDAFWQRLHSTTASPSWSSSAASSRSRWGSRAGSGCSTSSTTR